MGRNYPGDASVYVEWHLQNQIHQELPSYLEDKGQDQGSVVDPYVLREVFAGSGHGLSLRCYPCYHGFQLFEDWDFKLAGHPCCFGTQLDLQRYSRRITIDSFAISTEFRNIMTGLQ